MNDDPYGFAPRKLTHLQAAMEQHLASSRMTIPERLAAMTELNRRLYAMRGIDPGESIDEPKAESKDELNPDLTARRVPRRRS